MKFYRLEQNIKSIINSGHKIEEEYFLLSEKWLKEFKNIFNYNEILTREVINKINENENSHNKIIVDKIINDISENIKINLRKLEGTNIINEKLNNPNLYKINKNINYWNYIDKSLFSYALINEKIIKSFEENNINIKKDDLEKIKCLFLDNKLFIKIKKNEEQRTLNIGYYKDNLFIPDLIINSNRKNINNILDHFKSKGYNKYIQYLLFENEVNEYNGIKIININKDIDAFFYNKQLVSGKLKAFIFLNIYYNDIIEKTKNSNKKESEEVYLVNLQWLNAFGYSRVNEIIKKNINNQFIKNKNFYDNELFNEFILSLEQKEIKEIEKDLKENNFEFDNFYSKPKLSTVSNNKKLCYFNDFIVMNRKIYDLFCENFNTKKNYSSLKFYSGNKINIVEINNNQLYVILLGSILNNENIFKLEYIFFYNDYFYDKDVNEIYEDYKKYIHKNLTFNNFENNNNCISPIFNNDYDKIVGYCYKYNDNLLTNNLNVDYNITNELINLIKLYHYYEFINNKVSDNSYSELNEYDYYLVNSQWMNQIKTFYNYELIKQKLNSNYEVKSILNENNNYNSSFVPLKLKNIYKKLKINNIQICSYLLILKL